VSDPTPTLAPTLLAVAIERALSQHATVTSIAQLAHVDVDVIESVRRRLERVNLDDADRICLALKVPLRSVIAGAALPTMPAAPDAWCERCNARVCASRIFRCPYCDQPVVLGDKPWRAFGPHLRHITPDLLASAYQLYARGASLRQVAAVIHDRTGYSTPASTAESIRTAWGKRGWKLRPRRSATIAANKRRRRGAA
jgi:hypothetical protein